MSNGQDGNANNQISAYYPYTHFVSPEVIMLADGCASILIYCKGCSRDHGLIHDESYRIIEKAMTSIEIDCTLYFYHHRHQMSAKTYRKRNESTIATEHRRYIQSRAFRDDYYFCIKTDKKVADFICRDEFFQMMLQEASVFCAKIDFLRPRIISNDNAKDRYILWNFLSFMVNGAMTFSDEEGAFFPGHSPLFYPEMRLADYVSRSRIHFAEDITFIDRLTGDKRLGAIYSVKEYGNKTDRSLAWSLSSLPFAFVRFFSYRVIRGVQRDQMIKRKLRMFSKHKHKTEELHDLLEIEERRCSIASSSHHFFITGKSPSEVNNNGLILSRIFARYGFVVIREDLSAELVFWSLFPGNDRFSLRSNKITSNNFAQCVYLPSHQCGFRGENHLGSPLVELLTDSRASCLFNCHRDGEKHAASCGHTAIVGATGSGKSVLMGFLHSHLMGYAGRSFFFDRNGGMRKYINMVNGDYYSFSPDDKNRLTINPFSFCDTAAHRVFFCQWVAALCSYDGCALDSNQRNAVDRAVTMVFENLPQSDHSLSAVVDCLPVHSECAMALKRWINDDGFSGGVFSDEPMHMSENKVVAFDMTFCMDHWSSHDQSCLLMFLFYMIETQCDGKLVSIFCDEAWQCLANSFWRSALTQWLLTLRKNNAHVLLSFQSLSLIADSEMGSVIQDNCASWLFLNNPSANRALYCQHMKLSDQSYRFITDPTHHRDVLISQDAQEYVVSVDFSHLPDLLQCFSREGEDV